MASRLRQTPRSFHPLNSPGRTCVCRNGVFAMALLLEQPHQTFTDEFGAIDREVYAAAVALWPRAERYALQTLRDAATGQRLLMKACALVTRRRHAQAAEIANLSAYLYRTWQRLLLDELEKENGHRRLAENLLAADAHMPGHSADALDRRILLQQIVRHMDDWARRVFEYLTLGFTYDEIARELGGNGHAIRIKFDRQIQALSKRLNASD